MIKWTLYTFCVSCFAFMLFLYGFFPLNINSKSFSKKEDLPNLKTFQSISSESYSQSVNKVVLMIIDAFRNDFIYEFNDNMPFLQRIIKDRHTCAFVSEIKTPTVTLPRIKALTTGYIPAYIDVVLNFGTQALITDNIIYQFYSNSKDLVFYGDDTWLKLFPNLFKRFEGTTSFYVTDFYEVDYNVTKNVRTELLNDDWSVMILHYLGLDHIGHVEGPQGKHIKPKLKEMDDVIEYIYKNLIKTDSEKNNNLFIISGDHGMRDSGGHGGSSEPETNIPLIFAGNLCEDTIFGLEHVQQIDLVPTLSVLLGIPIPMGSIGVLIDSVITRLNSEQQMYALYYNAMHLAKHCDERLESSYSNEYYKDYLKAVKLYEHWLLSNKTDDLLKKQSSILFISSMKQMSKELSSLGTNYNEFYLILSMILVFEALGIILSTFLIGDLSLQVFKNTYKKLFGATVLTTILTVTQILCTRNVMTIWILLFNTLISVVLSINFYIIKNVASKFTLCLNNTNNEIIFMIFGIILHALSLSATSFIEEEHMIYYHLSSSYLIILLIGHICRLFAKYKHKETRIYFTDYERIIKVFCSLSALRILRDLNSTGDKHQNAYDYSDWLNESDHVLEHSVLYIIGLCSIFITIANHINCNKILKYAILFHIFHHIYYFKSLTYNIIKLPITLIPSDYILLNILVVISIIILISSNKTQKSKLILASFLLYLSFLQKPHNVFLLSSIIFILNSIFNFDVVETKISFNPRFIGAIWIGFTFYFMQGNSNNLATVDVSSGYSGLSFYNPFIVALQIAFLTYSGPLLAIVNTLVHINIQDLDKFIANIFLCKLVPLSWYLVMVYFQRNHLFAWTVFAPKLIYESAHIIITLITVFVLCAICFTSDKYKLI